MKIQTPVSSKLSSFPVLLEVLEDSIAGGEDSYDLTPPTDVYSALYVQGPTPDGDSVRAWSPVAAAPDVWECQPFYTAQGQVGYVRDDQAFVQGDGQAVPLVSGLLYQPCCSSDGKWVAGVRESSTQPKLAAAWVFESGSPTPREVFTSQGISDLEFSPDGKTLWMATEEGLFHLEPGSPAAQSLQTEHHVKRFTLSPDNRTLVYMAPGGHLRQRDLETGSEKLLCDMDLTGDLISVSSPVFSPDGSRILWAVETTDFLEGYETYSEGELWAVPCQGGDPCLVDGSGGICGLARPSRVAA